MPDEVTLVGLDFGTTTSCAVVATASLASGATGRVEFGAIHERFRSERVFTALDEHDRLDERAMEQLLESWLAAGNVRAGDIFGGGAMLTGLTAQKENAQALIRLVRSRLGQALIATADDPRLESWLAFMGNCAGLSRAHPDQVVVNLDIGGGTTNLAVGLGGQVLRTGCFFVGARHVQVVPGSYQIVRLSRFARALFDTLGIVRDVGDRLSEVELDALLSFQVAMLEAAVGERPAFLQQPATQQHVQVSFDLPPNAGDFRVTFSGGVGELIYEHCAGKPWPARTCFGDLGIDLARRIVESPVFIPHLGDDRPASAGRATVYGLLRYATEISGSTLFLPREAVLPLSDTPIFGRLDARASDERIRDVLELVRHSARGGCVQLVLGAHDASTVRALGGRISKALRDTAFPVERPLVFLLQENLGKVLGNYVTDWGTLPVAVVVIDEVPVRDAQYVHIGAPRRGAVPVSFFGLNDQGGGP